MRDSGSVQRTGHLTSTPWGETPGWLLACCTLGGHGDASPTGCPAPGTGSAFRLPDSINGITRSLHAIDCSMSMTAHGPRTIPPTEDPEPLPKSLIATLPLRLYRMTVAYDGHDFHGWQKQTGPHGELRTVSGVLEAALRRALRQPVHICGASRTDAGVHAKGQVAVFEARSPIPIERLGKAINSRLPEDVEVRDVTEAPPRFDPINEAVCKQYRYRIFHSEHRPLELRRYVWHCWHPLDVSRMHDAAGRLIGTHDFAGFAQAHHGRKTTVRTLFECRIEQAAPELHVVVVGDGFLYNMVRIIAGTLAAVGAGQLEPSAVDEALATGDRRRAGPTLPPEGLWLEWVHYNR